MIAWFVNIAIIALGVYILKDIRKGFCAALCARILFPEVTRFQAFGVNLAIYDILIAFLGLSFLWSLYKREFSDFKGKKPSGLIFFIIFYYLSSCVLIFFSADLIPQEEQFKCFFKTAFQETFYLIVGYYALRDADRKFFFNLLIAVACVAGLYGIYAYMTSSNPYVMSIISSFSVDSNYDEFLTEARGALKSRTSGTLAHPLTWGQLWGLLFAFYAVLSQTDQKPLWFNIAFSGLALINILLCGSRTALISAIVFGIFFFFSRESVTRFKILAAAFIFLMGVLALPINDSKYPVVTYMKSAIFFWDDSYSRSAGINGSNADMRLEQLDEVVTILEMFPMGGLGYNSTTIFADHPLFDRMRGFESVAFRKTLEQGWLGFLCFLISFAGFAIWSIRNTSTGKEKLFMAGYFASYMASILVTGIQSTWFVFLLLPLLYSSGKNEEIELIEEDLEGSKDAEELDDQD
ncbi:O-antigen ligase [Fibrobacter sp. UWEL]|uniref:O-antigen ligase family protein n=1 Tax=Fibrobacter sp. UWEL TaxID=1896209 RepID=UPI0009199A86|nr:O-antigen ligase family protein [Fibrobacter sp. UWEL]SHK91869.1 hypothetical protein SAMN05720468_10984 [Fibrobacter sp. UWEL]